MEQFYTTLFFYNIVVLDQLEIPKRFTPRRRTLGRSEVGYPELLRRVVVWDPENEREIVLLTNLREIGATTVAAIYKERWKIELFFEAITQNLTVKTFVGSSENALRIQSWTAVTCDKNAGSCTVAACLLAGQGLGYILSFDLFARARVACGASGGKP